MARVKSNPPVVTRREMNLEATRAHIVAAAGRLFLAQGYANTTLVGIAREAGVAVQTLYNAVGNKSALLNRVLEAAAVGPEAPRSVPEFMRERTARIHDAGGITALLADWLRDVNARMGRAWHVVDDAAAHDPEVARVARDRALRRFDHYREAAEAVRQRGGLRGEMDMEGAAALIWAVGHPQVYRTLVEERGWSPERYRQWVAWSLDAALTAPPPPASGSPPDGVRSPA